MLLCQITTSLVLSYLSVYQPELLSDKIDAFPSKLKKAATFVVLSIGSFLWIFYASEIMLLPSLEIWFHLLLIQIAVIDGYLCIIPNRLLILLLIPGGINLLYVTEYNWVFVTAFWCSTIGVQLGFQFWKRKTLLGWGDIKLLLVLALLYQSLVLQIITIGIVLAGLFALSLVITKKGTNRTPIPLAPFFVFTVLLLSIFSNI